MPNSGYKRLTWRSRRATRIATSVPRATLLLGEDHLLKVESSLFSENYRRYYFRDIQSITIRTNLRFLVWNLILFVLLCLFLFGGFVGTLGRDVWTITMVIMALITAGLLVANNMFGVSCDVQIQTAVQTDDLAPLSRVKRANRALEQLRPLITQAQGQFTAEETIVRLQELKAAGGARVATSPLNL